VPKSIFDRSGGVLATAALKPTIAAARTPPLRRTTDMRYFISSVALFFAILSTWFAFAGDCCHHCGCQSNVRKVCRLTCDVKKVPETKYWVECEDFCMPCPAKKCGWTTELDCDGCEVCKPNWVPQGAKVYSRTTLRKSTTDKEQKVYKWVVEYVCDQCAGKCADLKVPGEPLVEEMPSAATNIVPVSSKRPSPGILQSLFRKL
jgi:hypothetical protein